MNKRIDRSGQNATQIFDDRSLEKDYRTLVPILKPGMKILDVGCGSGAISRDIAEKVGPDGFVLAIDNTKIFIENGKKTYGATKNLKLIHADLFTFDTTEKFDLIVAARMLQWLTYPVEALKIMKRLLKQGGMVSVLDYNHEAIEWHPAPPLSMQKFYRNWLKWRADAGMNNRIAEDLPRYFEAAGFTSIEVNDSEERYERGQANFQSKTGIWTKVAGTRQVVEEGYVSPEEQRQTIEEYDAWREKDARLMIMKLKEVRGSVE